MLVFCSAIIEAMIIKAKDWNDASARQKDTDWKYTYRNVLLQQRSEGCVCLLLRNGLQNIELSEEKRTEKDSMGSFMEEKERLIYIVCLCQKIKE